MKNERCGNRFPGILGCIYSHWGRLSLIIGRIVQLYRYPVKSFAGESLQSSKVESYGLYGDRSHALIDPTKQGWNRFVTARQLPGILGYRAHFQGQEEVEGSEFPPLTITASDGKTFSWNEELREHFQQQYMQPLSLERHSPASSDLLAVDTGSVLLTTESSLRQVEREWGKTLDARRFRPNVIISLVEDRPFAEAEWEGRRLHIGSVSLQVDMPCERCMMITLDPDSSHKDNSILQLLQRQTGLTFGMYASVVQSGIVRVGDQVSLE